MTHHPIRDLPINAYCGERDSIAMIGDGNGWPFFRAKQRSEAIAKAEAWRQVVIEKHEASFIARQEAAHKARLKAKAKSPELQTASAGA